MCEIAPEGKKCLFDRFDTLACNCHRLNYQLQELKKSIPFFGKGVKTYECPDFEEESEVSE